MSLTEILSAVAPAVAEAAFLATIANRLVAGFITPLFDKFKLDKFYLMYVSWAIGGALVFLTGLNFFQYFIASSIVGQVLSAIVAGGGANLLHDLFDKPQSAAG